MKQTGINFSQSRPLWVTLNIFLLRSYPEGFKESDFLISDQAHLKLTFKESIDS